MNNRIARYMKNKENNIEEIRRFFLACEYKPNGDFWNIIEPFAYDIKPAYIYGNLGVMSYEPESYSIVEMNKDCDPLMGYVMTITNPDTIQFLDRAKYFLGENAFNMHIRNLARAYVDTDTFIEAWAYMLSTNVITAYQKVQTVEYGIWDDRDEEQVSLLAKVLKT